MPEHVLYTTWLPHILADICLTSVFKLEHACVCKQTQEVFYLSTSESGKPIQQYKHFQCCVATVLYIQGGGEIPWDEETV